MIKKRILITGGSGFLGQYLNIELSKDFDILTTFHNNPGNCINFKNALIDLRNEAALKSIFKNFNPDIVVHTAAYSTPDICNKTDKDEVLNFNVGLIRKLYELCNNYNSKLIFTSTDLVYKSNNILRKETDELQPKSFYAETKILGEELIKNNCKDFIILRTSLLYGTGLSHTKTHFQNMIESLKNNQKVNLFIDQYRTPLETEDAARILSELIKKDIKNEIINFGGAEKISRFEMGELVCDIFGFDKNNLVKTDGQKMLGDIFVADVSMDTSKLHSYGIQQTPIEEVLQKIKARLEN